jgi:hypothetical protein
MSKSLLGVIALVLSFSIDPSRAADNIFEQGVAKASLALGASDLASVSVGIIEPQHGYIYAKAYMWGGDETSPPKTVINAITVLRNSQKVFIPLSAYADLGNPRNISLERLAAHGFRLTISGGDAAGSYTAILDFHKTAISRRKVVSGEFPKEVWEQTIFSFNNLNN